MNHEETGLYDLGRWNEDYWDQFSNFIEMGPVLGKPFKGKGPGSKCKY